MAGPYRGWDSSGMNFRSAGLPAAMGINDYMFPTQYQNALPGTNMNTPLGNYQAPPPLPPRNKSSLPGRNQNSYINSYLGGYGGGYGGLGGYGSYGSYGGSFGMSPYRYGSSYGSYNSYGYSNGLENRFVQMAEESSRPAFQSIRSLVETFGSVTMMLESTFNAMHSSFLAVLGVAENFGRLRSLFGQVFSMFSLIRLCNWLFKKILYLLGLSKINPVKESAWNNSLGFDSNGMPLPGDVPNQSNWPLLTFLGVVLGAPYVIYKLIGTINPSLTDTWDPKKSPGSLAVGFYDFRAGDEQELSFRKEEKIMIAPKKYQQEGTGWLLAANVQQKVGFVPHNYIGIVVPDKNTPGPSRNGPVSHADRTVAPSNDFSFFTESEQQPFDMEFSTAVNAAEKGVESEVPEVPQNTVETGTNSAAPEPDKWDS